MCTKRGVEQVQVATAPSPTAAGSLGCIWRVALDCEPRAWLRPWGAAMALWGPVQAFLDIWEGFWGRCVVCGAAGRAWGKAPLLVGVG